MSNLSGLSAILTVSLVAIVTLQMLKDKFDMVENYGEEHNNNNNNSWTFQEAPLSARNVSDVYRNMPDHNQNMNDETGHGLKPLGTGDFFRPPFVSPEANANGWNGFPEAYSVYQQSINAATPNIPTVERRVCIPSPNNNLIVTSATKKHTNNTSNICRGAMDITS